MIDYEPRILVTTHPDGSVTQVHQYRTKTRWIVGSGQHGWSEWKDVPVVQAESKECDHQWVDADNKVVKNCLICVKCKAIQAKS